MRSKAHVSGKVSQVFSPERGAASPGPVRTIMVRRGSLGPSVQVQVPEGTSQLHAGLEHLKQTQGPDTVDDWFVIEE